MRLAEKGFGKSGSTGAATHFSANPRFPQHFEATSRNIHPLSRDNGRWPNPFSASRI
jgi:hypothetical protein